MDELRFETLYREQYLRLRRAARQIIHDDDAAHDIVQEVFVRFWHKLREANAVLNAEAYLYTATINASITYITRNKTVVRADMPVLRSTDDQALAMENRELQARIQRALQGLPPKCRAIFTLSRFEEKKNREIAQILGLSLKTVENQMGIALKKLREQLRQYLGRDVLSLGLLLGGTILC